MKWLQIARAVLMLIPAIIAAIQALEEAIPGEGKGEQRLAAIREILQKIHAGANETLVSFEEVWPALASTIGVLVATFNSVGWGKSNAV